MTGIGHAKPRTDKPIVSRLRAELPRSRVTGLAAAGAGGDQTCSG
jgi:hypothetical protein